jgi:hypothetical protein
MTTAARRTPRLECLERRDVPATFGIPWTDAQHLTVSFVPDGTDVHGRASDLFKSLKQQGLAQADWQAAVLRAVQTWAVNANINVGLVEESGSNALGTDGAAQGDSRFGDIRIAGVNLGATAQQLAITTPHDPSVGTLAGDIILNTGRNFGTGEGTRFDLYMVMMQEVGHAFGLSNSTDHASVMYEDYQGVHGLAASDIASIQALYGPRSADAFENLVGNDSFATATGFDPTQGVLEADITTNQDADVYTFAASAKSKQATIQVLTDGLSLLNARVTVYDANHNVIGSATSNGAGNDFAVNVNVQGGETYFVKVTGASGDVFAMGSYRLKVVLDGSSISGNVTSGLAASINSNSGSNSNGGRRAYAFDGSLAQSGPTTVLKLNVAAYQVTRFDLGANSGLAGGKVTILDSTGKVMATLTPQGKASTVFVLLSPGAYTVRLDTGADLGVSGTAMCYTIAVKVVTDPIDAYPSDPTENPVGDSGGSDGGSDGSSDDGRLDVTVLQPISPPWGPG